MRHHNSIVLGLVLGLCATVVQAQGLLVVVDPDQPVPLPRPIVPTQQTLPPTAYKLKELAVQAKLVDQVARVQVSQSFVNTGSRQLEVSFMFPLPYDGAIDRLTLMVDGKEIPAKLLPAKQARSVYESIVRKNKDPALLEWMGTGMFQTSVFPVPPGAQRKVTLNYSQLLRTDHGLTDFIFPLSTAKYTSHPVEKVDFQVVIESAIDIKNVYSPTHSIDIQRSDAHFATVSFTAKNVIPNGDFRLFYDVGKGKFGTSVVSYRPDVGEDGYLLLLASPQFQSPDAERQKKTVVFVVDRSGSMEGEKIDQARAAVKYVLENLRDGDQFNIVAYDTVVESFRPELLEYNDQTRKEALGFIEGLYAGGGTNIDGALNAALSQLKDDNQPKYVLFMTDGQPTIGETNESKIVGSATKRNQVRARIVSFGVGYDVNSRLLDRISRENNGQTEYVRPNEDIEVYVSRLYSKISSPVLTDVAVRFEFDELRTEEGDPINRVFPKQINDVFEGEQLVLVGRYRKSGLAKVTITGSVGNKKQTFDFPGTLVKRSSDESYAFVEKLWAMRRVGKIIDHLDLVGKNDELVKELVSLSTKHGILTPYTSFLADENARADLALSTSELHTRRLLGRLGEAEGQAAFTQRSEKRKLQQAARPVDSFALGAQASADGFGVGGGGATFRDIDSDEEVFAKGLKNIGNYSLYSRGQLWCMPSTAKLDLKKDLDKIKVIARFSDDYFKLVQENNAVQNQLLCSQNEGEELLVELRGQTYWVK
ncbi:MAG: VWA domain-containing protein [Planctomycetes bacterium]|nr:VWA domain-containing protein [Planctomycetota bacterium]